MKRTMHYTQCDICKKTDIFNGVDFIRDDWHSEHDIDECLECNENGVILHKEDFTPEEREQGKHVKGVWWWVPNE